MIKLAKLLLLTFVLIYSLGCNSFLVYDVAETPPKLVINATLYKDSVTVHLSKSATPFGETKFDALLVNDAKITLTDLTTNQPYTIPFDEKGKYKLFLTVKENHLFKIEASATGFETAFSESVVIPEAAKFDIVSFGKTEPLYQNGQKAVLLKFKLKDSKPEKNYYYFNSFLSPTKGNNFGFQNGVAEIASSCDFVGSFLSDKCFNQADFTLEYFAEYDVQTDITFQFSSISPSYFEYQKSLPQPGNIENAFTEPNYRYSNIKNGYGVFVANNQITKTYKLF